MENGKKGPLHMTSRVGAEAKKVDRVLCDLTHLLALNHAVALFLIFSSVINSIDHWAGF